MGWTSPKTWGFKEVPSSSDFNTFIRDNMNFLYFGLQRVLNQWVRVQTADVASLARSTWTNINSGGLDAVTIGEVQGNDIIEVKASARCTGAGISSCSISIAIYDGTTLVRRYTGSKANVGESATIAVDHQVDINRTNLIAYLSVNPAGSSGTGTLTAGVAPEVLNWFSVTHKRPPAA